MHYLRTGIALVAGFMAYIGVAILGFWVVEKMLGPLVFRDPDPSTIMLSLLLLVATFSTVFGCYLAARLAPAAPRKHAMVLGTICFLLSLIATLQVFGDYPLWYLGTGLLLILPAAWAGGEVRQRKLAKRNESRV
jgi:hypothetical protein